jgi:putative ABC transport system substrate-binding protein
VKRRDFLGLLGASAAFPLPALGQRSEPEPSGPRRLGVLTVPAANDPLYKPRAAALVDGLAALGWKAGDNIRIDWRYAGGNPSLLARYADELVALAPDALLAAGSPCVEALRRRTRTIPIVFTVVTDPVGQGFVESLSHPGGNMTGFTDFDVSMAGKWLEMLTEIAPPVATISVLYSGAATARSPSA